MAAGSTTKKITRGISKEFAEAFKESKLLLLYKQHNDELFIGIRNNYLNLYYNCDSIAKVKYANDSIYCEIDKYYLDGNHYKSTGKEKRQILSPEAICAQYKDIKRRSDEKSTSEKKAQSRLVILNNNNDASNWFCVDIEYVKQFRDKAEKVEAGCNGRFDIIALSRKPPHKVALIELKYGSGAIAGKSGIYKHVEDFYNFCRKGVFEEHLKHEIIEIIQTQIQLGISVPFAPPQSDNLLPPEFYFITLNNNPETPEKSTPKQTMAGYLFNTKVWGCKKLSTKYCVQDDFGDITRKNNKFFATFIFSKASLGNIEISDIIDGDYDEKIIPE